MLEFIALQFITVDCFFPEEEEDERSGAASKVGLAGSESPTFEAIKNDSSVGKGHLKKQKIHLRSKIF